MRNLLKGQVGYLLLPLLLFAALAGSDVYAQADMPEGFASVDALGQNGTTGGAGGTTVTVTTTTGFLDYITRVGPYVIEVADTIALNTMVNVQSHKSIIGVGDQGVITGGGLDIDDASNIIIRNLLFEGSVDDAINVQEQAHHIWIDHCDFSGSFDGLVDIKRGSDFVTVSWNKFSNQAKTCLLGHDDNNGAQDSTHLRVTYHHNWFNGTTERHPRVRFSALCHVYNNYYLNNSYGIASTMNAEVLVEGNYFENVINPTHVGFAASGPGDLVESDNIYDNCPNPPQAAGEVPAPPYAYELDDAANVPALVMSGAGRAGFAEPTPHWRVYDAGVLPDENDPAYAGDNITNPPDTTSRIVDDPDNPGNKLLEFINLNTDASKFMWGIDWGMDAAAGATIAFRVKPIDAMLFDRTFEVEFRDGSLRERLFVLPGGNVELDRADVATQLPYEADGWHTYRITYQNGVSTVYLDEQETPFLRGATTSANTTNDLRFGDGSDGNTYGFYLDWFIFDTSGVYAPGESDIPDGLFVDSPPEPEVARWQVYDASVLPNENDPAYAGDNITNPPDTTSSIVDDPEISGNKLLEFINLNTDASKFMWGIDWGMDAVAGATIAFRVKPIDAAVFDRTFEVEFRDGSLRERLFVLPGGRVELDRADISTLVPYDADGWHTYRITYQNGNSTVYLDEQETPFLSGATTSANSTNDLRFGDGSDGNTYGFYLDWFIFDTTGVYAPGESEIPEGLAVDSPAEEPVVWQIYDASVLPNENDPAYIAENITNPPDTTSWVIDDPAVQGNKLLRFENLNLDASKFMWGIDWNMDAARGATIAFRVKPIDLAAYDRIFEVEFRDGSLRERLFVLPNGNVELDRADIALPLPEGIEEWHTYRVTYQDGFSTVYVDEDPTPFLAGTTTSANTTNDLRFGDGSDDNTYGFYLDWFIFDTTGARAPGESQIPEGLIVDRAGEKQIVFISEPSKIDPATGENADKPFIDDLVAAGYGVSTFYDASLGNASEATIQMLNDADLVIIGRSSASVDFSGMHKAAWNSLRSPVLLLQLFSARSNRLNWFNTETAPHYNDPGVILDAIIELPEDPVFDGLSISDGLLPWAVGPYDVIETKDAGNGTLLARSAVDSSVQFVRFEPGIEFYDGAGDMPAGHRTLIGNGNDDTGIFNYYNFTDEAKQVYLAEVARMVELGATPPTSVSEDFREAPASYQLAQNYPNPFNPSTNIQFQLPAPGHVTITIYNSLGQLVTTLLDGTLPGGTHRVVFDAGNHSSGIYFYKIRSGEFTQVKKMMLLR